MPSTALDSVARLRRLAAALVDGDGDARWLAGRLRHFFDSAERGSPSLDEALDLAPGPGGQTWLEQERRAQRDTLLRDMAAQHFPGQRPGAAANVIGAAWRRYSRNRRAIDLRNGATAAEPGTLDAGLYALGKLGGPPAEKRLSDIIATAEQPDAA